MSLALASTIGSSFAVLKMFPVEFDLRRRNQIEYN